jgi:hypothetical protein
MQVQRLNCNQQSTVKGNRTNTSMHAQTQVCMHECSAFDIHCGKSMQRWVSSRNGPFVTAAILSNGGFRSPLNLILYT